MAAYKVSYKVLSEQGNALKAIAKDIDTYATRLNSVKGKLGDDNLLAEIRQNLSKLAQDMGESRAVLAMAGDVLTQSVEGYSTVENQVVKNTDNTRAHKRDFYKNPVAVASVGGGGAAAAYAGAVPVTPSSGGDTINYTDNSVHIKVSSTQIGGEALGGFSNGSGGTVPVSAAGMAVGNAGAEGIGRMAAAGMAAGAAALGAAAGAGGVIGVNKVKEQKEKNGGDDQDPED